MASKNPFDATLDVDNEIKVNTFDWTHRNNLTTQIGRITPIFCDLLPAHSTFRVNPVYGLQAMPMVFPIQTPLNARISFFKDLYRDWETDRKSTRLNSSHSAKSRMPSSA